MTGHILLVVEGPPRMYHMLASLLGERATDDKCTTKVSSSAIEDQTFGEQLQLAHLTNDILR